MNLSGNFLLQCNTSYLHRYIQGSKRLEIAPQLVQRRVQRDEGARAAAKLQLVTSIRLLNTSSTSSPRVGCLPFLSITIVILFIFLGISGHSSAHSRRAHAKSKGHGFQSLPHHYHRHNWSEEGAELQQRHLFHMGPRERQLCRRAKRIDYVFHTSNYFRDLP